jgi:hypothetical protein
MKSVARTPWCRFPTSSNIEQQELFDARLVREPMQRGVLRHGNFGFDPVVQRDTD